MSNIHFANLSMCPSFNTGLGRTDPALAVKRFIGERREWFARSMESHADALDMCHAHALAIDGMINSLFSIADQTFKVPGRAAMLALGGYGRMEMGLHCDIDLLFLHEGGTPDYLKVVTDSVLYPLWNNGAEVGGATRSLDDCRAMMESDVKAVTAMMEARFICGDPSLHRSLTEVVASHLADRRWRKWFMNSKIEEMRQRLKRFGDSTYLMQPNVKESAGGLRDYHSLMWAARAACPDAVPAEALLGFLREAGRPGDVIEALGFLWRIRHALHLIEGKKADRLVFALQAQIAGMLGFREDELTSASEALMSSYHRRTGLLHECCARATEKAHRRVTAPGLIRQKLFERAIGKKFIQTTRRTLKLRDGFFDPDPIEVLKIFAEAKRRALKLDVETKNLIIKTPISIDDGVRDSANAAAITRGIFSTVHHLDLTLSDMHECGWLTVWFPEMEPMFYRIGSDGVHCHTAGQHSIRAVAEVSALLERHAKSSFRATRHALKAIKRENVLALATFLHDIGKGRGGEHANIGAGLSEAIAKRIGFTTDDATAVSFLVRSHLLMTLIAFRRDIRDPALAQRFARSVGSEEMLSMLYLLTIADLRAVAPGVYNNWKGGLLAELYEKTRVHLIAGEDADVWGKNERQKRIDRLKGLVGRDFHAEEIQDFISALPERYLHSTNIETIAAHLLLAREITTQPLAAAKQSIPDRSCTEFSIVTRDAPGLFANIAGVLSANGANIVDAELYTSAKGLAIDILWLTDADGKPFDDPDRWQQIHSEIGQVISGARDIGSIVGSRFQKSFLAQGQLRRPTEVMVDNDVSALETVVEVTSDDRRGLLYTIASTFREMGCTIDRARITTHVDRVIDVFYIRDSMGNKISSRDHLEHMRDGLIRSLEG